MDFAFWMNFSLIVFFVFIILAAIGSIMSPSDTNDDGAIWGDPLNWDEPWG